MLEMRQVSKVYRREMVEAYPARPLDLDAKTEEFIAINGHSCFGKTAFLNIPDSHMAWENLELIGQIQALGPAVVVVTREAELVARVQHDVHVINGIATGMAGKRESLAAIAREHMLW
ncbi:ABC transporter [Xanthomonas sacchari]|uniref:Uncharacterized protein n=1 Tax=Xanthomonas sacchari TaxID=56458 RepID=A0A2P5Z726_9XANT|nr:ABC transporter [Xanthomonas sacchari]MDV0437273.1 hypothetical protein [Xanthomonas sacchari]PPU84165.1 hypothetical protein XsacCFBP4641_03575 [Xanthomonas sacchari]